MRKTDVCMNGFLTVVVSKNDTGLPYDLLLYSLGKRSGHSEPRLVVDIGSERVPVSISSAPEILADKAIEDFFAVREYICCHLPLLLLHWNNDCTDKEVLTQLCETDKE